MVAYPRGKIHFSHPIEVTDARAIKNPTIVCVFFKKVTQYSFGMCVVIDILFYNGIRLLRMHRTENAKKIFFFKADFWILLFS